jgi:hypothetical protein
VTWVIRDLDLKIQIFGLRKVFRKENVRILAELRRGLEVQPKQRNLNSSMSKIKGSCGNEKRASEGDDTL